MLDVTIFSPCTLLVTCSNGTKICSMCASNSQSSVDKVLPVCNPSKFSGEIDGQYTPYHVQLGIPSTKNE